MADINVQRKSPGIWPWIIGLIVLALLIWALTSLMGGDNDEVAAVAPVDPAASEVQANLPAADEPQAPTEGAGLPLSQIIENPQSWTGRTVSGEASVDEVPTDRGFWIEHQGERLFVILNDAPRERPVDINTGQALRIREATVHNDLAGVPGDLDPDTRRVVQGLPVFLTVDEANLEIVQPAGGGAGSR